MPRRDAKFPCFPGSGVGGANAVPPREAKFPSFPGSGVPANRSNFTKLGHEATDDIAKRRGWLGVADGAKSGALVGAIRQQNRPNPIVQAVRGRWLGGILRRCARDVGAAGPSTTPSPSSTGRFSDQSWRFSAPRGSARGLPCAGRGRCRCRRGRGWRGWPSTRGRRGRRRSKTSARPRPGRGGDIRRE